MCECCARLLAGKPAGLWRSEKAEHHGGGTVGRKFVRHDRLGAHALMHRHFAQPSRCSLFVPPPLDEHIQDLPLVIDSPPREHPLSADPDNCSIGFTRERPRFLANRSANFCVQVRVAS